MRRTSIPSLPEVLSMRLAPLAFCVSLALSSTAFAAPIAYQGELIDAGVPADGRYDLQLTVHGDAALSSALALPVTLENVAVEDGRFRVEADFGDLRRAGLPITPDHAWLEIGVRDSGSKAGFDSLAQREKIVLDKAIAACWSSTGDDGSNPAINFLGTLDAQPLELRVNNQRAARFEPTTGTPNLLNGSSANLVDAGVRGAVIAGGGAAQITDPDFSNENVNRVSGHYGVIGGGLRNTVGAINEPVNSAFATIGGGEGNFAIGLNATIGGGRQNDATERQSTVAGGSGNEARAIGGFVGGGFGNVVLGTASTIAGGDQNDIALGAEEGSIGGGQQNEVAANRGAIAGGFNNVIPQTGGHASIGGGTDNIASGEFSHVGGGRDNVAFGPDSVIGGGDNNSNGGDGSTIAGGRNNVTASDHSTIGGGFENRATGLGSSVVGGRLNQATGNSATVSGGAGNCAGGETSWAGGNRAIVRGNGCGGVSGAGDIGSFVWADESSGGTLVSFAPNQFIARAAGGFTLMTNAAGSSGVRLQPGSGAFDTLSDRNLKSNITAIDPRGILDALVAIPIATWNYTTQSASVRHIGPMAQDFAAAFKLGSDDRHINTVDADGVALAAIQGLNAKLEAENATQRALIARLEARLASLEHAQSATAGSGH
jgi:hypothetical protein